MILISHRGNLNGRIVDEENNPDYINYALKKGFNVEVDVRFYKNKFYLGHDEPNFLVEPSFLTNKKIWCHAKDSIALEKLSGISCVYFWHNNDDYTITSNGFIWTNPGIELLAKSICVLPELANYDRIECLGICSDFISKYRNAETEE